MNESVIEQNNKKNKKKDKRKDKKEKKSRRNKENTKQKNKKGLFTYLKETNAELKRVSWSSKRKTIKDSCVVVTAITLAVLFSFIVDSGISFFLKILIK